MTARGMALLLLAPFFAAGQTAGSNLPEFEAASVKPVAPGTPYGGMRGGPGTGSPGQIHYEATTLRAIVARAYGVQRFQIVGPRWFDGERYDFVARIPPGTTMPRLQLMLQRLLADRFHLELHKESRLTSVDAMTVARSGLKMRAAQPPATSLPSADAAPARAAISVNSVGEKIELRGHAATVRQFLLWINEETRREIVDNTGLSGAYDFEMSWSLDPSADSTGPSESYAIDAAIEKYLGLKVSTRKTPVEMLVIDRLERTPVEN
jgi:uncharacterized protein (TIGR03435 family)